MVLEGESHQKARASEMHRRKELQKEDASATQLQYPVDAALQGVFVKTLCLGPESRYQKPHPQDSNDTARQKWAGQ